MCGAERTGLRVQKVTEEVSSGSFGAAAEGPWKGQRAWDEAKTAAAVLIYLLIIDEEGEILWF